MQQITHLGVERCDWSWLCHGEGLFQPRQNRGDLQEFGVVKQGGRCGGVALLLKSLTLRIEAGESTDGFGCGLLVDAAWQVNPQLPSVAADDPPGSATMVVIPTRP